MLQWAKLCNLSFSDDIYRRNSIVKIHKCTSSHFQTNFKLIPRKQLENNIKKQHNTNQNNFGLNLLTLRGRVVI